MLSYNEVAPRKFIMLDGAPYEVLASHVFRKQQRKPVNQTKLKNLITGKVVEHSFHQAETIPEAEIETRVAKYLYTNRGESWFVDPENPRNRFQIDADILGNSLRYIRTNDQVDTLVFEDSIIGVTVPIKVELKVTEAAPAVKGNTATGATKQVTLETGATISVPLFINEGDILRINTETGEYTERVEKG
jgi:elongation factor P